MKFFPPFRTGDVVMYLGDTPYRKGEHIIDEVKLDDPNYYRYSTHRGAWFDHAEFQLVRECDAKSIKALKKARRYE